MGNSNLIIACISGGFVSLIIGFIWYHPKVLGTIWMREAGLTEEKKATANMLLIFGITFLICTYLTWEMKWINHPDEKWNPFLHGIFHGITQGGVFAAGAVTICALFEQRSARYIAINAGYWFMVLGLIGGLLGSGVFGSFSDPKPNTENIEESTGTTGMNIMLYEEAQLDQLQQKMYHLR